MNACLAERPTRLIAGPILAVATALTLAPLVAAAAGLELAQARSGPIPLGPPVQLVPPPVAPPTPPSDSTEAPVRPQRERSTVIEIAKPTALDSDSIGVLDENRGGFPGDLWDGTSRLVLRKLLSELPAGTKSAAMRDLVRRALSTAAQAPARLPGSSEAEAPSLIGLRAQKLAAFGLASAAEELAKAVPGRLEDEALARVLVDGMWMIDDRDGACKLVRGQIARMTGLYWQQALIVCQALSGEHDRAALGLNLMREQSLDVDPALVELVGALAAPAGARAVNVPVPSLLHFTLLRAADLPIPDNFATSGDLQVLHVYARAPGGRRDSRLAAAERAEMLGALSPAQLAEIYDSARFTAEQIAAAESTARRSPSPANRALLYRAVKASPDARVRVDMLRGYLAVARAQEVYPSAARLVAPLLRALPVQPEFAEFAGEAARALLLAGAEDEARSWYDLVNQAARGNPAMAAESASLWPLLRIAGGDAWAPSEPGRIERWLAAQRQRDPARAAARASLLAALFSALREDDTMALGPALVGAGAATEQGRMPSTGLWLALKQAATQGRLGEAILIAATILGVDGPAGANALTVAAVVEALRAVGQEPDARAVALEAALAAGL